MAEWALPCIYGSQMATAPRAADHVAAGGAQLIDDKGLHGGLRAFQRVPPAGLGPWWTWRLLRSLWGVRVLLVLADLALERVRRAAVSEPMLGSFP